MAKIFIYKSLNYKLIAMTPILSWLPHLIAYLINSAEISPEVKPLYGAKSIGVTTSHNPSEAIISKSSLGVKIFFEIVGSDDNPLVFKL